MFTEELDVRGLATACAGTAKLEQRVYELAVLDVGLLVDEVVLVGTGCCLPLHHHDVDTSSNIDVDCICPVNGYYCFSVYFLTKFEIEIEIKNAIE